MITAKEYRKSRSFQDAARYIHNPEYLGDLRDSSLTSYEILGFYQGVLTEYFSVLEKEFDNVSSSSQK